MNRNLWSYKLWELFNDNLVENKSSLKIWKLIKVVTLLSWCKYSLVWFNLFVNKLGSVSPGEGRKLIDSGLWISFSPRCQNTAILTFSMLYYVLFLLYHRQKECLRKQTIYPIYIVLPTLLPWISSLVGCCKHFH